MITKEIFEAAVALDPQLTTDFDLNPGILAALPENRTLRPAAVLIPVIERETGLNIILTKRASHMKHHPGQIALPGGKYDDEDTDLRTTALRESEEEIGLNPTDVEVVGLIDKHETYTSFELSPYVGFVRKFAPRPQVEEVDEIFEVPADFLMNLENIMIEGRYAKGILRQYYVAPYGPYYIWGATARILHGLAKRVALCR